MLIDNKGSSDFVLPAEGPDVARCYMVVDLGTQKTDWEGKTSYKRQVMFAFELPNQLHPEKGTPLIQYTRRFTATLGEKGALRPFLEAWRGTKFSDAELAGFDAKKTLGKAATLQIGHETKDGRERSKIMSIMGVMAGIKPPPPINEPLYFATDHWDQAGFDKLPEWIRKVIAESEEAKARGASVAAVPPPAATKTSATSWQDMEEDIPF